MMREQVGAILIAKWRIVIAQLMQSHGITPKRVTSDEAHLRSIAPGQHRSEETSQQWRAVCDTALIWPARELNTRTFRTDSLRLRFQFKKTMLRQRTLGLLWYRVKHSLFVYLLFLSWLNVRLLVCFVFALWCNTHCCC